MMLCFGPQGHHRIFLPKNQGNVFKLLVLTNQQSKAKDILFTVIEDKESHQMFTFLRLESFFFFCFQKLPKQSVIDQFL